MVSGFLLFLLLFVTTVCFSLGISFSRFCVDARQPLNFMMFREPSSAYSAEVVSLWVPKPWRHDGSKTPVYCEKHVSQQALDPSERSWMVYSHGNGENLLDTLPWMQRVSARLGWDVVSYDYPGYGLSDYCEYGRTPAGVEATLSSVLSYFVNELGYNMSRLVLWGYSLGTGPSTVVACRLEPVPRGLILFGAYASIKEVVTDHAGSAVAQWFDERWSTVDNLKQLRCPLLLMHGQSDGMIRLRHMKALAKSAREAGVVATVKILPNAGHTNFNYEETVSLVEAWSSELR